MELPSKTIAKLSKYTPESTMRGRNERWFGEFYYKNRSESRLMEYNKQPTSFVIGKIYTFFYFNPKYKNEMDFWSSVPVGIFVGYHFKTKHPLFLNLMFIPPAKRLMILDKITSVNSNGMDMSNKFITKSGSSIRQLNTKYVDLKKYLKNSGFEFAIRSYIITRINAKPLIITYYDWWRIATFPSQFTRKKSVRQIYALYYKFVQNHLNK